MKISPKWVTLGHFLGLLWSLYNNFNILNYFMVLNRSFPFFQKPKKKKSFECQHCEKVYTRASNLQEHVRVVHEKKTPFECDQCSRKFGFLRTLEAHKHVVHAKVTCDACGQTMYNTYELKMHKATVHGIIPSDEFKCEHCPKVFKAKANLFSHINNKHMN